MRLNNLSEFADIQHLISTKSDGWNLRIRSDYDDKNVEQHYREFCEAAGVPFERLCVAIQDHTDVVLTVDEEILKEIGGIEKPFKGIDGFMTNLPGVPLLVRFADCQGALFYDPVKKVVAAVHSGWRGVAQNILGKTLLQMKKKYGCDPADIVVGIGPSLGPCCAEFSNPRAELPEFMHKYIKGTHVDLWESSLDELKAEGVLAKNIEMVKECTVTNKDKYHSFRGDGETCGHMGAVIMLI